MATSSSGNRSLLQLSDIPTELRLKIYKAMCFVPRNVDVWSKDIFISARNREDANQVHHRMYSRRLPPAILHVSREARQEALKHYVLSFGASKDVGDYVITSRPKIYVNPMVDTICLPRPETFLATTTVNTGILDEHKVLAFVKILTDIKIRSLAVNFIMPEFVGNSEPPMYMYGDLMPSLSPCMSELIIFADPSCYKHFPRPQSAEASNPFAENVGFRDLSDDEINAEEIAGVRELRKGHDMLSNYFERHSDLCTAEESRNYERWTERLCVVEGKWPEVEQR